MSKIEVDAIEPQSGTTLTLGASGDTITVPSGATLDVTSATVSGITSYTNTDALTLFNAGGSAPVFACRAWVNFNGTGTPSIRADGNVTSITDNGTGNFTVNFTTAMEDNDFSVSGCTGGNSATPLTYTGGFICPVQATTSCTIITGSTNADTKVDREFTFVAIFR